jgi:hypothetical protein
VPALRRSFRGHIFAQHFLRLRSGSIAQEQYPFAGHGAAIFIDAAILVFYQIEYQKDRNKGKQEGSMLKPQNAKRYPETQVDDEDGAGRTSSTSNSSNTRQGTQTRPDYPGKPNPTPAVSATSTQGANSQARAGEDERRRVARRAFEIYEESGRKPGRSLENWLRAEAEIRHESTGKTSARS